MIRVCGLLGLVAVLVAAGATPRAEAVPAPAPAAVKLGVLSGMFKDVPPDLVQAVAAPFRDLFKRQTGLDGEIVVVADHDTLAAQLDDQRVHFGVFHGFEWAWVKAKYPELRPLVVTIPPGEKLHACLVVGADCKAETPADLTDPVSVPTGTKAHCQLYLDRLRAGTPAAACKPDPVARGSDDLLDAVAAGKTAAALVDAAVLAGYMSNRPGPGSQLRVLAKSDPFPPAVVVYRAGAVDAGAVEKVRAGLVRANATPQGKAFMVLWKLKGFKDVSAAYEADLAAVLKAYPPPK